MTLDDIATAAAGAARARARDLSVPPFDLAALRRRRRRQLVGQACVTVIVVGVIALALATRGTGTDAIAPTTPDGAAVRHIDRPDLGVALDIPASWPDTRAVYHYPVARGATGPQGGFAFVTLDPGRPPSLDTAADWWSGLLAGFGATQIQRETVVVDGGPAIAVHYAGTNRGGQHLTVTSFVIATRTGRYAVVAVGWPGYADHQALADWIMLSIRRR